MVFMYIEKTLSNGLRVICEQIPYIKSVSVGIWAGVGSRLETEDDNGLSHFAEHMLFKGTERRSAQDIAEETDFIGGNINAFTSRECTCYYAKVVDTNLEKAIDILSDMYVNSLFRNEDVETERRVILEEISMYEDSPEDIVLDALAKKAWQDNPLGYVVSGTPETVKKITAEHLLNFTKKYYTAENTVLAVAGSFECDRLFELAEKYFSKIPHGETYSVYGDVKFFGGCERREKEIEQTHIAMGFDAPGSGSDDIYATAVLCNVLGGTVSSRLFREIREERGLAYSVYSMPEVYKGAGMFLIYAGLSRENLDDVREIILGETENIRREGITPYELLKGREQLRGSYILGLESVSGRMNSMGKSILLGEKLKTPDENIKGIDGVTNEDINRVAERIFGSELAESILISK